MLVDWFVSQPCPIFNQVDCESELEELVQKNQVVLLGLFDTLKEPDPTWVMYDASLQFPSNPAPFSGLNFFSIQ